MASEQRRQWRGAHIKRGARSISALRTGCALAKASKAINIGSSISAWRSVSETRNGGISIIETPYQRENHLKALISRRRQPWRNGINHQHQWRQASSNASDDYISCQHQRQQAIVVTAVAANK